MKKKILLFSKIKKISEHLLQYSEIQNYDFIHSKTEEEFLKNLPNADILLTDMTPFLSKNLHKGKCLKWIQSTYAGVDGLFKTPFEGEIPNCVLTKFGGKFGKIMTQYCLQHILNHERHYKETSKAQNQHNWDCRNELNGTKKIIH